MKNFEPKKKPSQQNGKENNPEETDDIEYSPLDDLDYDNGENIFDDPTEFWDEDLFDDDDEEDF
jgi:hypothetical protein